jgi:hypothetical protein
VTLDEDKNSTLEKDFMESEKVDANHHISHNKNVGTFSKTAPTICNQWKGIVKKVESSDNALFVIKEVCNVISSSIFLSELNYHISFDMIDFNKSIFEVSQRAEGKISSSPFRGNNCESAFEHR